MNRIQIGKQLIALPSSWQEMTEQHLQRVAHVLTLPWDAKLQYTLIRLLTPDVKPETWVKLSDEQILFILPLTDFMREPVKLKSTRLFRMGFRWFWLPNREEAKLVDWAFAENLLKAFTATGEEKYLNLLVAAICRPKKWWILFFPFLKSFNLKWNGDPREKFHSAIMHLRAEKMNAVPMHKRLMVFWWVVQLRWEVYRENRGLFSGSGKSSGDWIDAGMEIAKTGIFGGFEDTMQTNLNTILKYLNHEKSKAA
jgi:hypothetical protein